MVFVPYAFAAPPTVRAPPCPLSLRERAGVRGKEKRLQLLWSFVMPIVAKKDRAA